ncbi:TSUP family transporter [Streptomyces oryzae]|uniref:Probable membrane transporter protein n=1 Tax=Streptomyces oryzae TaxID=1434886 RepID=A0ABS3XAA3_9ACTN|nr:TSUP family transporter [Streptomyces oryzae]MBO8192302.1 TSUP family transporter [Streptomyces oryzae]
MSGPGLLLLATAVLGGAAAQRVTGLGFALVASPFLVLLLGPFHGVLLANALSLLTNLLVLCFTWRDVAVRKVVLLSLPALVMVVPGAWIAHHLNTAVLMVLVGTVIVVALLTVSFVPRARVLRGGRGAVVAGGMSGFMNASAGVGGPAITLYAVSTDWEHREFVGSMQLYFAVLNAASLAAKGGVPDLALPAALTALAALAAGSAAGHWLTRRIPVRWARAATTSLAVLGATATTAKGLAAL